MIKKRRALYQTRDGRSPFEDWVSDLKDTVARARIWARIGRASLGNLGDHRGVGGGVVELRVHVGPGYRVYVGLHGEALIVLLCGGDKSTQDQDIGRAQRYWEDFLARL